MTTQAGLASSGPDVAVPRAIDAHQHFWRIDRGDYGWLTPAEGAIYRDFLPADLQPVIARRGIDATILVQAAPTVAETRFLLDVAAATPHVAGVVGWAPLAALDAPDQIVSLAEYPLLVGLRPMVQDEPDDDWLAHPRLAPAFEAMIAQRLVFDALVLPRHLTRLVRVLERHPDLTVVVDHGAKPRIREGEIEAWRADMAIVAAHPNVTCKLSGLVTEADWNSWRTDDLRPFVDVALESFGADRIMFGSDYPVCLLAASYDRVLDSFQEILKSLSDADRDKIFSQNAEKFYRLN